METPLTTIKESEKKEMTKKSSALFDITNGSPIVGLATGILKTPSNQRRKCCTTTPGSGEALLRDQVKNLLQMVEEEEEEEAEKIISLGKRRSSNFFPVVAPTPANTPLMDLVPPVEDKFVISQILNKIVYEKEKKKKQESVECETSVTRSLLLDFCDKSEEEEEEIDELCEAIGNMNVNGGGQKFGGKRTKFVYNSDDEFVGVEEEFAERIA